MILVDPDLSPHERKPVRGVPDLDDPDAAPHASTTKRVSSNDSAQNDRSTRVPSTRTLARFLRQAQEAVPLQGMVAVLLTTDRKIRRLNREFRGKDKATDVLSFPAPEAVAGVAGDLAISVPTALRQSREQGHALGMEIKVLMLHGLLHLAGFDHETDNGQMARRERLLRGRLGLPQGLIERIGGRTIALKSGRKVGARGMVKATSPKSRSFASLTPQKKRGLKRAPLRMTVPSRDGADDRRLTARRGRAS